MRYSIKPRKINGYESLPFAENIGKNRGGKYGEKFLHQSEKYAVDTVKNTSKREIQKTTETTADSFGKNK